MQTFECAHFKMEYTDALLFEERKDQIERCVRVFERNLAKYHIKDDMYIVAKAGKESIVIAQHKNEIYFGFISCDGKFLSSTKDSYLRNIIYKNALQSILLRTENYCKAYKISGNYPRLHQIEEIVKHKIIERKRTYWKER